MTSVIKMTRKQVRSYQATVFIAGDFELAKAACRKFCDEMGECVTVDPTHYAYTNGSAEGVRVGFINYGRFPRTRRAIFERAEVLARWLLAALDQDSVSIVATDRTVWLSSRSQTAAPPTDGPKGQDGQDRDEHPSPVSTQGDGDSREGGRS